MAESAMNDIAGTRVFIVASDRGPFESFVRELQAYGVEASLFDSGEAAISSGKPHVVAYVKSDGARDFELMKSHFQTARFLVIGDVHDEVELLNALGHGVHGWVMPWEPPAMILTAILLTCRGGAPLSLPVLEILQRRAEIKGEKGFALANQRGLTGRQVEILELVNRGHSDKEIAALLTLSVRTVQRHVQDVLQKLDIHSRQEAVHNVLGEAPPPARQSGKVRARTP